MSTPEGKVKALVRTELVVRDAWFFFPPANGFGKGGIPDVVGCLRGRFFGIECKAPGKLNTVTELQKLRLQEIKDAGGFAIAVDGIGMLRDALDEWERSIEN